MTSCANCGRPIPCGCPNPARADAALTSLFGLICDHCDGYNDPGREACLLCGEPLVISQAASADASTSVTRPPTAQVPAQPQPVITLVPTALPRPSSPTNQIPVAVAPPAARTAPIQLSQPVPLKLDQPMAAGPLPLTQVMRAETTTCPRCGTPNPPEFRFCTECGMALRAQEVAPPKAAASPVAVGRAAARVLRGERLGQTLTIGMQATAGRAQGPLSFPGDPFLVSHHCTLYFQQTRLFVRDEGSPSGTFVRLRDEEPLAAGDFFAIGDHLMRYLGPVPAEMTAADGTRILGCPRPPGVAVQIEEVHEGGVPGRNHTRLGPSLIIGRDDGCDLSFSGDPFVSGRHCNITIGPGGRARIRDMGSTNGTFRRLEPSSERELLKGDCIRIGSEVLQIAEATALVPAR
jgi:pSer/pThr/pTyr-binding forkhead associated (FHA) protein